MLLGPTGSHAHPVMIKDPELRWKGAFPYDVLAPAGVTPASPMSVVRDASFELMHEGEMTPEVRAAWDELRISSRRLIVDFFLYPDESSRAPGQNAGALPAELSHSERSDPRAEA